MADTIDFTNPFVAGPPITEPHRFFGRGRDLRRLFALWQRPPLQNAAIIGARRSGKTSLLHYLMQIPTAPPEALRSGQRHDWLPDPARYRWVYVDFQDPRLNSREGLLCYLLTRLGLSLPEGVAPGDVPSACGEGLSPTLMHRIRATLTRCAPLASDQALRTLFVDARLHPWRDQIPTAGTVAGRADAVIDRLHDHANGRGENALVLFLRALSDHNDPDNYQHRELATLAAELEAAIPGTHPTSGPARPQNILDYFVETVAATLRTPTLILLDEIDVVLKRCPDLDDAFWESLRALATHMVGGNLGFVLAAAVPPYELARGSSLGSPFFNIFGYTTTLGPLREAEARALIAASPIPFPPEDVDWILVQSGRWPVVLQTLCRERLIALQYEETDDAWREDGMTQIMPYAHLLNAET
jgi:hypothetical protein